MERAGSSVIREAQHGTGREVENAPAFHQLQEHPMSSRGKPVASRRLSSARAPMEPHSNRRSSRPANSATRRWRRDTRAKAVRAAVSTTKALRWNRRLIEVVLEELYVDDHFEKLLAAPRDLRPSQYAQAIAIALILRHSWHPNDLACMLKRLKLGGGDA